MRFSCSQCGKRYATADVPIPGRIYRLKCKACGNLIVVKGSEAAEAAAASPAAPADAPSSPSSPPPAVAAPTPVPAPAPQVAAPTAAAPAPAEEAYRPPVGGGYVDLFADGMATSSTVLPAAEKTPAPAAPADDPFARAARVDRIERVEPTPEPPPPTRDPFADTRAALARAETPEPDRSPRLPTPRVPEIPRPPEQKQRSLLVMVAPFVVLVGAIVAFAVWKMGATKKPSVAPPPAPVTARVEKPAAPPAPKPAEPAPAAATPPPPPAAQPAPPPAVAEAPPPAPPPPAAVAKAPERKEKPAPKPEPKAEPKKPARPEKQPEKVARAEPEKAPPPPPPPVAEKPAEKPADRPADKPVTASGGKSKGPDTDWESVAAQEGPSTLTPDDIRKVMAANKKVLDACLTNPGRGMDQKLPARQVILKFMIAPSGAAGYPTIDEVVTSNAPVGQCLKGAVKLIGFPSFSGDPVKAEYPIQIPAS